MPHVDATLPTRLDRAQLFTDRLRKKPHLIPSGLRELETLLSEVEAVLPVTSESLAAVELDDLAKQCSSDAPANWISGFDAGERNGFRAQMLAALLVLYDAGLIEDGAVAGANFVARTYTEET